MPYIPVHTSEASSIATPIVYRDVSIPAAAVGLIAT
jgi:hypothetical protein